MKKHIVFIILKKETEYLWLLIIFFRLLTLNNIPWGAYFWVRLSNKGKPNVHLVSLLQRGTDRKALCVALCLPAPLPVRVPGNDGWIRRVCRWHTQQLLFSIALLLLFCIKSNLYYNNCTSPIYLVCERNSFWCQINRKAVTKLQIVFDLARYSEAISFFMYTCYSRMTVKYHCKLTACIYIVHAELN